MHTKSLLCRILSHIQYANDGCWVWGGAVSDGYAKCYSSDSGHRQCIRVHRALYQIFRGKINNQLDHLCRNRDCVNPYHLEDVTFKENVLRGMGPTAINARAVVCKRGHPLDDSNTYIRPTGYRMCRRCHADAEKIRRDSKGRFTKKEA